MSLADCAVFTNATLRLDCMQSALENQQANYEANVDQFFIVTMAMIIFLMQAGFACLEAGSVRTKNTVNILMKNFLDSALGAIVYWAFGWSFAFGGDHDNVFIGGGNFFLADMDPGNYSIWFFHFVFAATAATIVSGAMAERTTLTAYCCYSVLLTGFAYPVVTHWAWDFDNGWLATRGYKDFAGSGVVHCVGGAAALVGAMILGPRINRFNEDGSVNPIPGHSVFIASLGAFILWFGFFAFNGGSQAQIAHGTSADGDLDANIVALCIVNTTIAGAAGAVAALIIVRLWPGDGHYWSLGAAINGALAGMVAICAGVNDVYPWAAFVIGGLAGLVEVCWSKMLLRFKIDDPLDAAPVHLGAGLWGVIAAPLFGKTGVFYTGSQESFDILGVNAYGVVVICAWSAALTGILLLCLKHFNLLRVPAELELAGLDIKKHGEIAYPEHDLESNMNALASGYPVADSGIGVLARTLSVQIVNKEAEARKDSLDPKLSAV